MEAIEFTTDSHNGIIYIPRVYEGLVEQAGTSDSFE